MDELTQSLFQFQLEELEKAISETGGMSSRDDTGDDAELAFLLQREEFERTEAEKADHPTEGVMTTYPLSHAEEARAQPGLHNDNHKKATAPKILALRAWK
ncbi:MAG: hypothetical protein Q9188_006389 [Gyalolechia gomerana]